MRLFKLFLLAFIGFGCSENKDAPEPMPLIYYEDVALYCLLVKDGEFIIRSKDELIEVAQVGLGDSLWNVCIDTTQLPVDFEEHILLGKYTTHDLNDNLNRYVYKQDDADVIIYKIKLDKIPGPENSGGFGNIYSQEMNWIIIQKPPDYFEVKIEYEEY